MRYTICLAWLMVAPIPTGVSRAEGLHAEIHLSADSIALNGNVSIAIKLVNENQTDLAIDRNSLTAWLTVRGPKKAPIREIPFCDEVYGPGASTLIVPSRGRKVVRVFGATVAKGKWTGFGTSGKHEGVALVLRRDAGMSCYPT